MSFRKDKTPWRGLPATAVELDSLVPMSHAQGETLLSTMDKRVQWNGGIITIENEFLPTKSPHPPYPISSS